MKESMRWLIVVIAVAALFYTFGRMHSWQGSIDRAAYDCRNYKAFQYEDQFFQCFRLTGANDE